MRIFSLLNSFRARLLLLLAVLLGLTLGVQYYVNLRSVRSNAHLILEQEQAIMAGVALGVNSISSNQYLDEMRTKLREPFFDEHNGRVRNVLVVDNDGNIRDSLMKEFNPQESTDGTRKFTRLTDVKLPPLTSAVEIADQDQQLPPWLAA